MASESESVDGEPVDLYIYDLTQGLAALLSPAIMGRQVEGVWHTSLVVFGREYYYGAGGIASAPIGGTMAGTPREVQRLGVTFVPASVFREYLQGLAGTTFTGSAYSLLEHNCNHFTDEVAQFLCGARIPKHIVQQPETDLPQPFRAALTELLRTAAPDGAQSIAGGGVRYDRQDSPDYLTLNTQIEEARTNPHTSQSTRRHVGTGTRSEPCTLRTLLTIPTLLLSLRSKWQLATTMFKPVHAMSEKELVVSRTSRFLVMAYVILRLWRAARSKRDSRNVESSDSTNKLPTGLKPDLK